MKKYLIILAVILTVHACDNTDSNETESSLVAGKTYVGRPVYPGTCDELTIGGCNPGFFEFSLGTKVDYGLPGDDIAWRTEYYEEGGRVYIHDFSLTIIEGGIEIVHDDYDMHFRDENYPWE